MLLGTILRSDPGAVRVLNFEPPLYRSELAIPGTGKADKNEKQELLDKAIALLTAAAARGVGGEVQQGGGAGTTAAATRGVGVGVQNGGVAGTMKMRAESGEGITSERNGAEEDVGG